MIESDSGSTHTLVGLNGIRVQIGSEVLLFVRIRTLF